MPSEVVAFAIPSRVALETDLGDRASGYVTHFEGGCIWVYLRGAAEPSFRSSVRLVFRREGEASLGMAGVVIWSAQDRVAVEVQHPVDRAIIRDWGRGEPADVSEFVKLHHTELPTAEFDPVSAEGDALDVPTLNDVPGAASRTARLPRSSAEPVTLEDVVMQEPRDGSAPVGPATA